MRTRQALCLLPALLMLAALPAGLQADDAVAEAGAEVWPGDAASDGAAARAGRAAMPFTAEQIEALGRLLRQTQGAAAVAADPPPEGRVRRVRIGAPGEDGIPVIHVRKGYVTAVSFTGATGAPWPIQEVLVDGRFLPEAVLREGGSESGDGGSGGKASHLLYLAPRARFLHGNAVVKLHGLAEPLALGLRGGGSATDFGVEVRLGVQGPNAVPGAAAQAAFHAGDPVLLDLLGGTAPAGAERLTVEGGERDDRAWRLGDDLLLLTRARLLSPGPWAAERGAGGRWAYRLPRTPYALATREGRERRLAFGELDEIPALSPADTGSAWND